ncbi:hypothetical protein ES703_72423 [subsurface metagenome]
MELSTLKTYRKIVPGATFISFLIPAYLFFTDQVFEIDEAKFVFGGFGLVLAIIIGTCFSSLKIRSLRNKKTHTEIITNIKNKLIKNGLTRTVDAEEKKKVIEGRQLMNVFYYFIDNDESLKEKSKLVRDNGLFWTSTADVAILGCFFTWLYFLLILFFGAEPLLVFAGLSIGFIGLLSGAILHPLSVRNHIVLGNEQLEFIFTNYKKELQDKINGLFD